MFERTQETSKIVLLDLLSYAVVQGLEMTWSLRLHSALQIPGIGQIALQQLQAIWSIVYGSDCRGHSPEL